MDKGLSRSNSLYMPYGLKNADPSMPRCEYTYCIPVFVLSLNPRFPHAEVQSKHSDGPSHRYLECLTDW